MKVMVSWTHVMNVAKVCGMLRMDGKEEEAAQLKRELKEIFEEVREKTGHTKRWPYRARLDETALPDDWNGSERI